MKNLYKIDINAFHFTKEGKGGMYPTPHPEGTFPEDATFISFDPETRTVTYSVPSGEVDPETQEPLPPVEHEKVFTQEQVEEAKLNKQPLPVLKERAEATLKANRDTALKAGFDFNGYNFQTRNETDILNITNVGIGAMADPSFQTAFIAKDNTPVPMDATTAQAFYQTMLSAGNAIWAAYATKRQAIQDAATEEELTAIDLTL